MIAISSMRKGSHLAAFFYRLSDSAHAAYQIDAFALKWPIDLVFLPYTLVPLAVLRRI
jgi:hypothetical protein